LRRTAALLERRRAAGKGLPALLFFTDPVRTPAPEAAAGLLPPGAGVVFRAFGDPDAEAAGLRLGRIARARGLKLLAGADEALAARIGADGVHLPERLAWRARRIKARRPGWIVTAAAHSPRAARRARAAGADAVVVSPVFPSRSPSAGTPLGVLRLALLARRAGLPVYALGGVNAATAGRLGGLPLAGLAAVEGLRT
jgi:thiamine-phosphate pyrophosphorylase